MNFTLSPTLNPTTPRFGNSREAAFAKPDDLLSPDLEDILDSIAFEKSQFVDTFLDQPFLDDQEEGVSLLGKQIQNKHILTLVTNFLRNSDTNITPRDVSGILKNTFNTLFALFNMHAEKLDHTFSIGVQKAIDKMIQFNLITQKDQALQLTPYGKAVAKEVESEGQ